MSYFILVSESMTAEEVHPHPYHHEDLLKYNQHLMYQQCRLMRSTHGYFDDIAKCGNGLLYHRHDGSAHSDVVLNYTVYICSGNALTLTSLGPMELSLRSRWSIAYIEGSQVIIS